MNGVVIRNGTETIDSTCKTVEIRAEPSCSASVCDLLANSNTPNVRVVIIYNTAHYWYSHIFNVIACMPKIETLVDKDKGFKMVRPLHTGNIVHLDLADRYGGLLKNMTIGPKLESLRVNNNQVSDYYDIQRLFKNGGVPADLKCFHPKIAFEMRFNRLIRPMFSLILKLLDRWLVPKLGRDVVRGCILPLLDVEDWRKRTPKATNVRAIQARLRGLKAERDLPKMRESYAVLYAEIDKKRKRADTMLTRIAKLESDLKKLKEL